MGKIYIIVHGIFEGSCPSIPGICIAGKPDPILGMRGIPSGENCKPGASSLIIADGGWPYSFLTINLPDCEKEHSNQEFILTSMMH